MTVEVSGGDCTEFVFAKFGGFIGDHLDRYGDAVSSYLGLDRFMRFMFRLLPRQVLWWFVYDRDEEIKHRNMIELMKAVMPLSGGGVVNILDFIVSHDD